MTVKELAQQEGIRALVLTEPERVIRGAYAGDLLSWVMGKAPADAVWMTIMSNLNICAVASLTDVACVLLTEDVVPDQSVLDTASQRGINLLTTKLDTYEASLFIGAML